MRTQTVRWSGLRRLATKHMPLPPRVGSQSSAGRSVKPMGAA